MKYVLTALFISLCIGGMARADEQQIQANYHSFQSELQNGDLRAARDFAALAFDEALEFYGPGSGELDRYVAAYAKTLNDLLDYSSAQSLLESILAARDEENESITASYAVMFEFGRALWGTDRFEAARDVQQQALRIAEAEFGGDSLQAAIAHLELARAYTDRSVVVSGDALRNRLIGTGYPYIAGTQNSLDRATELFAQHPDRAIDREILNLIRGAYEHSAGNRRAAGEYIEPAMEALAGMGYMDDYILTVYVDWVASHLTRWSTNRMERYLLQALDYGAVRQEGDPVPLARTTAVHNRRACVDLRDGENAYGLMQYSVNENGQVPRTGALETNLPNWWVEEQRYQMRQWIFIPAQERGQATRVDGLTYYVTVLRGRSC